MPPDSELSLEGRTLAEFVVREKLGQGGFGAIYRAEQPRLGDEAALAETPELIERIGSLEAPEPLSALRENTEAILQTKGMLLGSPPYMAPEQWADPSAADARSDLYALAVMAYEALSGRRPFA